MNIPDKWVEPLTNGVFVIVAALVGILGTLWVTRRTKDSKRLTLIVSPLGTLLGVDSIVKPRIKILYDEKPVETVFMGEFAIRNAGTLSIEPVKVRFKPALGTQILGFQFSAASFVNPDTRIKIVEESNNLDITVSFLNKEEHISFVYFSTGKEILPIIDASQPGLDVQIQTQALKRVPDIYAEVLLSVFAQIWWMDQLMRLFKPYRLYVEAKGKK